MTWLIEVFSDKSDQARLIAILISAVVAVLIVLLNQWFLGRRAKRELLIEKIEELYATSTEYIRLCTKILNSIATNSSSVKNTYYDVPDDLMIEFTECINKMEMICGLYFKSTNFNSKDYFISNMPIIEIVRKNKQVSEDESFNAYEDSRNHITISKRKLFGLCSKLMNKYGH